MRWYNIIIKGAWQNIKISNFVLQILMNVQKELMSVKNIVTTPTEAIPANALDLAINFTVTAPLVKVSHLMR